MNTPEKKKRVLYSMIKLYCQAHHGKGEKLCSDCHNLFLYAEKRVDNCPFREKKGFCSGCSIGCYQREMKMAIGKVMRYSGPRMVFYHPLWAFAHLFWTLSAVFKKKRRLF